MMVMLGMVFTLFFMMVIMMVAMVMVSMIVVMVMDAMGMLPIIKHCNSGISSSNDTTNAAVEAAANHANDFNDECENYYGHIDSNDNGNDNIYKYW